MLHLALPKILKSLNIVLCRVGSGYPPYMHYNPAAYPGHPIGDYRRTGMCKTTDIIEGLSLPTLPSTRIGYNFAYIVSLWPVVLNFAP